MGSPLFPSPRVTLYSSDGSPLANHTVYAFMYFSTVAEDALKALQVFEDGTTNSLVGWAINGRYPPNLAPHGIVIPVLEDDGYKATTDAGGEAIFGGMRTKAGLPGNYQLAFAAFNRDMSDSIRFSSDVYAATGSDALSAVATTPVTVTSQVYELQVFFGNTTVNSTVFPAAEVDPAKPFPVQPLVRVIDAQGNPLRGKRVAVVSTPLTFEELSFPMLVGQYALMPRTAMLDNELSEPTNLLGFARFKDLQIVYAPLDYAYISFVADGVLSDPVMVKIRQPQGLSLDIVAEPDEEVRELCGALLVHLCFVTGVCCYLQIEEGVPFPNQPAVRITSNGAPVPGARVGAFLSVQQGLPTEVLRGIVQQHPRLPHTSLAHAVVLRRSAVSL